MAYINKLKLRFLNPTDQNDENILYNKVVNTTFRPQRLQICRDYKRGRSECHYTEDKIIHRT